MHEAVGRLRVANVAGEWQLVCMTMAYCCGVEICSGNHSGSIPWTTRPWRTALMLIRCKDQRRHPESVDTLFKPWA